MEKRGQTERRREAAAGNLHGVRCLWILTSWRKWIPGSQTGERRRRGRPARPPRTGHRCPSPGSSRRRTCSRRGSATPGSWRTPTRTRIARPPAKSPPSRKWAEI